MQCTPINVFTVSKRKKSVYEKYPYLKYGVESENYIIKYISNPYKAFITYDTKNNYFFIAEPPYTKISKEGIIAFQIENKEYMDNPLFTHYVFDKEGVFDFSKKKLEKESFDTVINPDYSMSFLEWKSLFNDYYKKAEFVVYGNSLDYKYYPVYLKVNNKWILFLSSSYDGFNQTYQGIVLEGYPAKFDKMILLKANYKNKFSDGLNFYDTKSKGISEFYPKNLKIKKLYFYKELVSEHFPYTSIPQEFSGTAYYNIKINKDTLKFKENALKNCLGFRLRTYLYWYILPQKYLKNSKVSFLAYRYPHNINESGSNGLYIIKHK